MLKESILKPFCHEDATEMSFSCCLGKSGIIHLYIFSLLTKNVCGNTCNQCGCTGSRPVQGGGAGSKDVVVMAHQAGTFLVVGIH